MFTRSFQGFLSSFSVHFSVRYYLTVFSRRNDVQRCSDTIERRHQVNAMYSFFFGNSTEEKSKKQKKRARAQQKKKVAHDVVASAPIGVDEEGKNDEDSDDDDDDDDDEPDVLLPIKVPTEHLTAELNLEASTLGKSGIVFLPLLSLLV